MKKYLILLLVFAVLIGISIKRIKNKHAQVLLYERRPIPVYTYSVNFDNISLKQSYIGTLKSAGAVTVASLIPQKVISINKVENEIVRPGDLLIKLDDREIKEKVNSLTAKLNSIDYERKSLVMRVQLLEHNYEFAKKELNRNSELYKKNVISENVYDKSVNLYKQAKTELETSKIKINQITEEKNYLESNLEELKIRLNYTEIKSDVNGIVSRVNTEIGNITAKGQPLMIIENTEEHKIFFNFPQEYSNIIKKGTKVNIFFNNFNDYLQKEIYKIYPSVEYNRMLTCEIILNTIPENINVIYGSYVKLEIITKQKKNILTIPLNTVKTNSSEHAYVYKINDDMILKQHKIETGISDNEYIEVISGLKENDIIVYGSFLELNKFFEGQKAVVEN